MNRKIRPMARSWDAPGRREFRTVRGLLLGLVLAVAVAGAGVAQAATVTGSLSVQMTITATCSIGASAVTFASTSGTSLVSAQVTQTGTISVTCSNANAYSIGLDNGQNVSVSQRRMANGANFIPYNLYLDAGHTQPWTTAATNTACTSANSCYLGTGTGSAQTINIYGVVPTVASAPASGAYSDSVTITVTY